MPITPPRRAALLAIWAVGAVGCAADRPLRVNVPANIERPDRAVVLMFIDGFGRAQYHRALEAGDLPHIDREFRRRGVEVEYAVTAVPSITYANAVTFLTGVYPSHHGVIANRWFDPHALKARQYQTVATYQAVDFDYSAATVHDLLPDRDTTNFQAAQRRGADYSIDNWMSSGVNWAFGNYVGVDALVAQDLEVIAERHVRQRGRWPAFILAYFPAVDHMGHEFGPDSSQYRDAVRHVDRQVGRFCDGLRQAGMYDRTNLVLVSDHGVVGVGRRQVLEIGQLLRANGARRVAYCDELDRWPSLIPSQDAIYATCGSRWASVHVRLGADWGVRRVGFNADSMPSWFDGPGGSLLGHPAVEMSAGRHGPDAVWVRTRTGVSLIERRRTAKGKRYRYKLLDGDALQLTTSGPILKAFVDDGWHESEFWLQRTVATAYPDAVVQLAELFDSPRVGDVVLFASRGWDFAEDDPAGGHGSVLPDEMLVPMLFAGPDVAAGRTLTAARNIDVMPTIMHLLGAADRIPDPAALDGVSLYESLRHHAEGGPS